MKNGTATEPDMTTQLSAELKKLAAEAETLLESSTKDLAEKTKDIRDHLASALETAQKTVDTLETQAQTGMKAADQTIRSHPYQSIGVALGLGLALGLVMNRR